MCFASNFSQSVACHFILKSKIITFLFIYFAWDLKKICIVDLIAAEVFSSQDALILHIWDFVLFNSSENNQCHQVIRPEFYPPFWALPLKPIYLFILPSIHQLLNIFLLASSRHCSRHWKLRPKLEWTWWQQALNPSPWEADAGESLSLRPARAV